MTVVLLRAALLLPAMAHRSPRARRMVRRAQQRPSGCRWGGRGGPPPAVKDLGGARAVSQAAGKVAGV